MASIEKRSLKNGISYRVVWRRGDKKQYAKFPSREAAESYAKLIEEVHGDQDAADKKVLQSSSEAPKLSSVAEDHIAKLIDVEPYTKTKYRQAVKHHLPRLDVPIDQITSDDIDHWVIWMVEKARPGKGGIPRGYSPKTIKNTHGLLYSVFEYAVKRGMRPDNPSKDTRLPRGDAPGDDAERFLSIEEFAALLPHFHQDYQPYARFLFASGLRASELLALKPEDFTVVDGTAYVRITKAMKQDETGVGVRQGRTKTKQSRRMIDIDDATMSHVWPLIRSAGHGNYVFTAGTTQATTRLYQNMVEPAQARAQKSGFSKRFALHTFRHSHASYMLAQGMPIHELSWRLGHSSIQITIDLYGHLDPKRRGSGSKYFSKGAELLVARDSAPQIAT